MPDKRRLDVFISSTSIDLPEHRDAVYKAILRRGLFPSGMETWPVGDESPVDLCKRMVDEAEVYIGIFAHRYGWRPDGQKSITEMEYDWATARGIPRLCFIMEKTHSWPVDKIEFEAKAQLDAFKTRVQEHVVGFFTTPDNLRAQVIDALWNLPLVIESKATSPCIRLPNPSEFFAGRATERDSITRALQTGKTVAITAIRGVGGIGKTTLAAQVAHDANFDLKLWASLGQDRRDEVVMNYLREWSGRDFTEPGLTLEQAAAETRLALTRQNCGDSTLLVIDDVWPATIPLARLLRQAVPDNARVLLTTRTEDVAATLNARSHTLPYMSAAEGADLLLKHVPQAEPHRPQLEQLSDILRGHPLALNLAARQLRRNFVPRRLTDMIATFTQGLTAGDDLATLHLDQGEAKEDSVAVTLRQSLDFLSPLRQRQFRALGALPADLPFRADHALALWREDDETDTSALDDLAAEGLIELEPTLTGEWYTQHRLLRAYARALLRQNDEFDSATARHRQYLIDRAYSVFVERQYQPETWGEITDDLPQIHFLGDELVALLTATTDPAQQDALLEATVGAQHVTEGNAFGPLSASDEPSPVSTFAPNLDLPFLQSADPTLLATCADFAAAVCTYVELRYIGSEGRRWLWSGLAAAYIRDSRSRIRLFTSHLAVWHDNRGFQHAAIAYNEQSLAISRKQGDQLNEAATLNNIGGVWRQLGDNDKALAYYQQALPLSQAVGNQLGEAATLNNIGGVWRQLGDNDKALDYYQQALLLYQVVVDQSGEAATLNNIGSVWDDLGEMANALDYYQQALLLVRMVGNPYGEAIILANVARNLWNQGNRTEALTHMQTARDIKARIGLSTADEDYFLNLWRSTPPG